MIANRIHLSIIGVWCCIFFSALPLRAEMVIEPVMSGFQPPPGRDRPAGGTASGGSRPVHQTCFPNPAKHQELLTAVTPGHHLGLTMMKRPEFVVYLPLTKAKVGELSIFDQQMRGVYQMNVAINGRTGFVGMALPQEVPDLVPNQPYYWTFALVCNERDRTEDLVVGGWIERTEINRDLRSHLEKASFLQRVSLLARNGYWYDAIAEVLNQPAVANQIITTKAWENLLTSVGLNHIAQKPIHDSLLLSRRKPDDI